LQVRHLASHLADEEVGAAGVDGGVVSQERRDRDTSSICDRLACITSLYYPGGAARLSCVARRLYTQIK
jgi:hypothetical protein